MSDALGRSVGRLKSSTSRLNQIANEASIVVKAVEDFLNRDCGVGVEKFVRVKSESLGEEMPDELTHIRYQRYGGKFRIVVSVGTDPENVEFKPWSEWDRSTKLETVEKLPELIEAIADEVDARVTAAQQATAAVASVLNAINGKQETRRGYTPPSDDEEGPTGEIPF